MFQSTPEEAKVQEVSIHAPARRATSRDPYLMCLLMFQSTPPHGGRQMAYARLGTSIEVSIHAPARRATRRNVPDLHIASSFNPRPRTEGDRPRATSLPTIKSFNPRPRTEGDTRLPCRKTIGRGFNPRPRTEGDWQRNGQAREELLVSIHAPARRATRQCRLPGWPADVSIHAPARRAT